MRLWFPLIIESRWSSGLSQIIFKLFWLAYAVRSAIEISIGLYSKPIIQYNIRVKCDIKRIIDPSSDNIDDNEQIN